MNIPIENIGSAKDNANSAIHNWYKFTAGFSYKLVDLIIDVLGENPSSNPQLSSNTRLRVDL